MGKDDIFCSKRSNWKENNSLISNIKHPLAADCGLSLSDDLGIIAYQEGVCLRATFIVDPDNTIQQAVPAQSGLYLLVPGLPLQNGAVITAFASVVNVVAVYGFVNRIDQ